MDSAVRPIQNRIGIIFVPVDDISTAIRWYSRLFEDPDGNLLMVCQRKPWMLPPG
jgi:hypothetical protein